MAFLSKAPFVAPGFSEISALGALSSSVTEEQYYRATQRLAHVSNATVSDIRYISDGLRITGVEVLPHHAAHEKLPLLIYNRGGSGNFGMLSAGQILRILLPVATALPAGLLASNYRGNAGSEGHEEWGGRDVRDILTLIDVGKEQPWWDGKNIFMLGWSRGGMMTYLALKAGAKVNAVAVGAGVSNLIYGNQLRPEMENVCARFIENYAENPAAALEKRSAWYWPEKINAPVLLMHGDADVRVNVEESRQLYALLQQHQKEVKYVEYTGDDHGLNHHHQAWISEVVTWFSNHMSPLKPLSTIGKSHVLLNRAMQKQAEMDRNPEIIKIVEFEK